MIVRWTSGARRAQALYDGGLGHVGQGRAAAVSDPYSHTLIITTSSAAGDAVVIGGGEITPATEGGGIA